MLRKWDKFLAGGALATVGDATDKVSRPIQVSQSSATDHHSTKFSTCGLFAMCIAKKALMCVNVLMGNFSCNDTRTVRCLYVVGRRPKG